MGETPTFVPVKRTMFPMQTLKTDTEGSLAAAVEEMPAGYDELMKRRFPSVHFLY